jgi:hypothetical protein
MNEFMKGVPCVRLPNTCTWICPKKNAVRFHIVFETRLVNKSYYRLFSSLFWGLSLSFTSFEEVLYKARVSRRGRTITFLLDLFLFGTFARFFLDLKKFTVFFSFFLCAKAENDDNYYCDNSPPKQHYWYQTTLAPHIDQRFVGQIFTIHANLVPSMTPPPPFCM